MNKIYKVGALGRYFTFFLGLLLVAYSCYIIFGHLTADAPLMTKFIPFAILFFAINSVIKNLTGLHKLMLSENGLILFFLFGRQKTIPYTSMQALTLGPEKLRIKKIMLTHHENEKLKVLVIPKNIQDILEFLAALVQQAPHVECDKYMKMIVQMPAKNQTSEKTEEKES